MGASARQTPDLRAGIYGRISDDRELQELGVERQEEDCRSLADHLGWRVVDVYIDNSITAATNRRGRRKQRPQYQRMIEDIERGTINAIIVWRLDRLTRSPIELEQIISFAEQKGVKVASASGEDDFVSADGQMVGRIKVAVAAAEARKTAERVTREAKQRAEHGKPHGGNRRFGFSAKGMEIIDEEAAVIRQVAQWIMDDESLTAAAHRLNETGVKPARAEQWRHTTVRNMLTSPALIGRRIHNGVDVGPAAHGAILDEATWYAVQARLSTNRPFASDTAVKYLLSGVARCGECGSPMFSIHGTSGPNKYLYYACPPKTQGGCRKVYRRMEPTDNHVENLIKRYLKKHRARLVSADSSQQVDIAALESQIKTIEDGLIGLAVQYAGKTDALSMRMFRAAETSLRDQLEPLMSQREAVTRSSSFAKLINVRDIETYWSHCTLTRKREHIRALADITIHPANRQKGFDPLLVDVDFTKSGGTDVDKRRADFADFQAEQEGVQAARDHDQAAGEAENQARREDYAAANGKAASARRGWDGWDKSMAKQQERQLGDFLTSDAPEPTEEQLRVIGPIPRAR